MISNKIKVIVVGISLLIVGLLVLDNISKYKLSFKFTDAASNGLLYSNDLTYEGAFRLSSGGPNCPGGDSCTANYGGGAIVFDPSGDGGTGSIWVSGFSNDWRVAEFKLSNVLSQINPASNTLSALPTATKIQGWTDPTVGHVPDAHNGNTSIKVGGIFPYNGNLLINVFGYFGENDAHKSVFVTSRNLASPSLISGPHLISGSGSVNGDCGGSVNCMASWTSGAIIPIPSNYQSVLGGDALTTGCCYSIIGRTSSGPSATSFNLNKIGVSTPVVGNRLLGYPSMGGYNHPTLGNWDGSIPGTMQWTGGGTGDNAYAMAWPTNTKSILFFGTEGTPANFCYGTAVAGDADGDPVTNPNGEAIATGTGASTNSTGTVITLPNFNVNSILLGYRSQGWVWLKNQTSPTVKFANRNYQGMAQAISLANSGTPTASVTVSSAQAFPPNLTNQNYQIGSPTCYDPAQHSSTLALNEPTNQHAPSAYPYVYQVWAYNADDLAAVKAGTKNYWDVLPYTTWNFNLPIIYAPSGPLSSKIAIGGTTYDSARNKVYVVQGYTNGNQEAIVTVWGVNTAFTPPPSTPSPTPTPTPSPSPNPTPSPVTSPNCTKAATIVDTSSNTWSLGAQGQTLRNGVHIDVGYASVYKLVNGLVYMHDVNGYWRSFGTQFWQDVGITTTEPSCGTTTTTLVGDLNGDKIVNSLDWSIMNSKWFTNNATADLNHDGIVNSIDFSLLNANWFKTIP